MGGIVSGWQKACRGETGRVSEPEAVKKEQGQAHALSLSLCEGKCARGEINLLLQAQYLLQALHVFC